MKINITKSGMLALLTLLMLCSVLMIGCTDEGQIGEATEPGTSSGAGEGGTGDSGAGEQNDSPQSESFSGSMQDLIALGNSIRCTFSGSDDEVTFSGVIYVAGKKARNDVDATVDGKKISTHVIAEDKWFYTWSSMDPHNGIKMYINMTDEELKELGEGNPYAEQEVDYDFQCWPWIVDNSKFVLPSDVTFTDMSEMFAGLGDTMSGTGEDDFDMDEFKEMMCQNCDMTDDPAECKAEFC
ncbi:hypothetical protein K8R43_04440 [archaeon]|nr:hypothetical protein [archaeon]